MSVNSPVVSTVVPSGQLVDPKTGMGVFAFIKWMQNIGQLLNQVFDNEANLSPNALPYPTVTTLGGVLAVAESSHEWVSSIDDTGAPHLTQPKFSDISGTATAAQVPPLSGLQGSVGASQVPQLSQLDGSVTSEQVPPLSALSGQITTDQLPSGLGFTGTIVTAQLTPTGAQGSMTYQNGILVEQVPAT